MKKTNTVPSIQIKLTIYYGNQPSVCILQTSYGKYNENKTYFFELVNERNLRNTNV